MRVRKRWSKCDDLQVGVSELSWLRQFVYKFFFLSLNFGGLKVKPKGRQGFC